MDFETLKNISLFILIFTVVLCNKMKSKRNLDQPKYKLDGENIKHSLTLTCFMLCHREMILSKYCSSYPEICINRVCANELLLYMIFTTVEYKICTSWGN